MATYIYKSYVNCQLSSNVTSKLIKTRSELKTRYQLNNKEHYCQLSKDQTAGNNETVKML